MSIVAYLFEVFLTSGPVVYRYGPKSRALVDRNHDLRIMEGAFRHRVFHPRGEWLSYTVTPLRRTPAGNATRAEVVSAPGAGLPAGTLPLGTAVIAGRSFPIQSLRLVRGALEALIRVPGPFPAYRGPVTLFGEDGSGYVQSSDFELREIPEGGGTDLVYRLRTEEIIPGESMAR